MAKPELRDHRKFLKLLRLLGEPRPHVMGYLECLWLRGYQTGSSFIGDADDVEAAAEYPGERGKFTRAAFESGLIDRDGDGSYLIHDLYEHAPKYARLRMRRLGTAPDQVPPDMGETITEDHGSVARATDPCKNDSACAPKPRTQSESREPNPKTSGEVGCTTRSEKFKPPSVEEVGAYCVERKNKVDPERFVDFYASKGWRVGDQPMRDWKACVRTWEKRDSTRSPPRPTRGEAELESAKRKLEGCL